MHCVEIRDVHYLSCKSTFFEINGVLPVKLSRVIALDGVIGHLLIDIGGEKNLKRDSLHITRFPFHSPQWLIPPLEDWKGVSFIVRAKT
jgi:hypothetical protein